MSIEVIRYRLPVYWACVLINDDYSGLSEEEMREIDAFLKNAEGYAVDVDWETQGFISTMMLERFREIVLILFFIN